MGAEKEGHAATLSGSQSLTAELEAERANLAVQVNELSALKEQHTGWCIFFFRLKTVAFIAGKKNPAIQKIFIRFSIEINLKT